MEYPFEEKVIVLTETLGNFLKESLPVLIDMFSYLHFPVSEYSYLI